MARELLGNIRGPRGTEGPKGEDGGFNNETIGVNNLIDITKVSPRGTTSAVDYDLDNGLLNYNGVESYVSVNVTLNGVQHTFRVEDYLTNPSYYSGVLNFQMMDSDGDSVISARVSPKTNLSVDLTGRDRQEYNMLFRVTSSTSFSGFIEKPMLVEGDHTVLWNMSKNDHSYSTDYFRGRISATGIVSNTNTPLVVSLLETTGGFQYNSDSITLGSGTYLFNSRLSISFAGNEDVLHMSIFKNDERIARFRNNARSTLSSTYVVKAVEGDTLRFEYYYQGTPDNDTAFQRDDRTEFTITKL